jgi:hypothetical protein
VSTVVQYYNHPLMEAPLPRNASSHRVRGPDGANCGSYPLGEREGADQKVQAGTNTRASKATAAPSVRTLAQLAVALGRDAGTLLRLSAATLNAVIDEAVSEGYAIVGALARHELHEELARSGTVTAASSAAAAAAASPGLATTPDANAAAWHQYYQQQQYWQYYQQQQFQAAQQQMSSMHLDEQDCGSADSR